MKETLYKKIGEGKGARYLPYSETELGEETFYRKVGTRYLPALQSDTFGAMPHGIYLVHVKPGSTSVTHCIEPDFASVEAALKVMQDAMVEAMREAEKMRPMSLPITDKQKKAWQTFDRAMGDGMYTMCRASLQEIVDSGVQAVREYITA